LVAPLECSGAASSAKALWGRAADEVHVAVGAAAGDLDVEHLQRLVFGDEAVRRPRREAEEIARRSRIAVPLPEIT
jgi:hypothetical protein